MVVPERTAGAADAGLSVPVDALVVVLEVVSGTSASFVLWEKIMWAGIPCNKDASPTRHCVFYTRPGEWLLARTCITHVRPGERPN